MSLDWGTEQAVSLPQGTGPLPPFHLHQPKETIQPNDAIRAPFVAVLSLIYRSLKGMLQVVLGPKRLINIATGIAKHENNIIIN